ncbi:hypothetical protein, partial [uncultured Brevundimonas sp.]|uniref:hypothetical protein n=1 Tax=uncultured Brevundimonas sp. TaxID=213418 RepID=UPI002595D463
RQGDPNRLTPVRGGGGDLETAEPRVNRFFRRFCGAKSEPFRPQKTAGGKLGFPLKPYVGDSIGARNLPKPI